MQLFLRRLFGLVQGVFLGAIVGGVSGLLALQIYAEHPRATLRVPSLFMPWVLAGAMLGMLAGGLMGMRNAMAVGDVGLELEGMLDHEDIDPSGRDDEDIL